IADTAASARRARTSNTCWRSNMPRDPTRDEAPGIRHFQIASLDETGKLDLVRGGWVAIACVCMPACSLLTPLDGLSGGAPATVPQDSGPDDARDDVQETAEAASGVDGGTIPDTASLLDEWTFDSSCAG